jgi:hypothetical protein
MCGKMSFVDEHYTSIPGTWMAQKINLELLVPLYEAQQFSAECLVFTSDVALTRRGRKSQGGSAEMTVLENHHTLNRIIDTRHCGSGYKDASRRFCHDIELKFLTQQEREKGLGCDSVCDWLGEVREMRGRVFYDDGRRPFFRMNDGSFGDPDPVDLNAYHLVARSRGRAVGCARIVPPENILSGFIASIIGRQRFDQILQDLGTHRERTCEASRWVVVPECRGVLGPSIVVAAWTVARWLRLEKAFVLACTCKKQDVALTRMGAHAINDLPLVRSVISDDKFRLLYFDVADASESMERRIDEMAKVLNLDFSCFPRKPTQDPQQAGDADSIIKAQYE